MKWRPPNLTCNLIGIKIKQVENPNYCGRGKTSRGYPGLEVFDQVEARGSDSRHSVTLATYAVIDRINRHGNLGAALHRRK